MPKIVSHSIVSSSDQTSETSGQHPLHVYYCLCSEFILVIDLALERLPRRRTDRAFVVANAKRTYKLTAVQGACTMIKRPNGFEKQYRLHCPRCSLLIAYETSEKRKAGPYTYIVDGALTQSQGSVPEGAIDESAALQALMAAN